MGLSFDIMRMNHRFLDVICNNENIEYVGINSKSLWISHKISRNINELLDSIKIPCQTEIDLDIPFHIKDLDKIHSKFPNMKHICVIASINDKLPIISNVKITGYDPQINKCFD